MLTRQPREFTRSRGRWLNSPAGEEWIRRMNVSSSICVECSTPSPVLRHKIECIISKIIKHYLPDDDLNKITNLVIIPLFFKLGLHLSRKDYVDKSIIIMPECWFEPSPNPVMLHLEQDESFLKKFTYALLHEVAHEYLSHSGCGDEDIKEKQVCELLAKWTQGTDIINSSPPNGDDMDGACAMETCG